jgi:hypothetical protein
LTGICLETLLSTPFSSLFAGGAQMLHDRQTSYLLPQFLLIAHFKNFFFSIMISTQINFLLIVASVLDFWRFQLRIDVYVLIIIEEQRPSLLAY